MNEKRQKENALLRIATLLRKAEKECEIFDDLKQSPGKEINNLHEKVFYMQIVQTKKLIEREGGINAGRNPLLGSNNNNDLFFVKKK